VTSEISREEFRPRLAKRAPVELGRPAAEVVEEVWAERRKDLGA
jgi:hypothetical protein